MGLSPTLAVLFSGVICGISLWRSRSAGGQWILDPRSAASVLVFLHVAGFPIHYVLHGEYPDSFGFEPEYASQANLMLVTAQLGFVLATFLPVPRGFGPELELDAASESMFLRVLFWASLLTSTGLVYALWTQWDTLSQFGYGARQGYSNIAATYARVTNIGLIAIPTLLMAVITRASVGRPIFTRGVLALAVLCLVTSLLSGGRKDAFMVIGGFFLAWTFRQRRRPWKEAIALAVILAALSMLITTSRSGPSLALADRANAVAEIETEKLSLTDQVILMYAGTMSVTAAMTIYPEFVDHTLGRSYYEAAVNVLSPAFLTGRYPYLPMSHQFRELYYPNVTSYGFDYAMSAEAYQNFGLIGPFLVFGLVGYLLNVTFARTIEPRRHANPWLSIHTMTLLSILYALRTDSNGLLKQVVYGWVWIVALLVVARLMVRRPTPSPAAIRNPSA